MQGFEELFYGDPADNSGGLLPSYRTHPRVRTIDIAGMKRSLETILGWRFDRAVACHIDAMGGDECRELLSRVSKSHEFCI